MLIPITIAHSSSEPKLPPGLAKISHDEIVLIELQGTLEVESNHPKERNGKLVGTLKIDEITVFIKLLFVLCRSRADWTLRTSLLSSSATTF